MIEIQLDSNSGVPYYRQIIDKIFYGISSRKLVVGEKLPTIRWLAVELAINPNTVARAYKELEIKGFLDTQQGFGTYITEKKLEIAGGEDMEKLEKICDEFVVQAGIYGFGLKEIIKNLQIRIKKGE